jgi:hypothetical protein
MSISRVAVAVLLAVVSWFAPGRAWACTDDSECLQGRLCVRGVCVRPEDPGSSTRPGSIGADERTRTACTKRCDESNRACLARQPTIAACVGQARTNCNEGCKQKGTSAKLCALDCNSSEARWGWERRCVREGDDGRKVCLTGNVDCIKACLSPPK